MAEKNVFRRLSPCFLERSGTVRVIASVSQNSFLGWKAAQQCRCAELALCCYVNAERFSTNAIAAQYAQLYEIVAQEVDDVWTLPKTKRVQLCRVKPDVQSATQLARALQLHPEDPAEKCPTPYDGPDTH